MKIKKKFNPFKSLLFYALTGILLLIISDIYISGYVGKVTLIILKYAFIFIFFFKSFITIFLAIISKRKSKNTPNNINKEKNIHPFVSVIIPAYNEEKVIQQSVASVLNNTYKNLEILIINDGSTDRTLSILKKAYDDISTQIDINLVYESESKSMNNERDAYPIKIINKFNSGKSDSVNVGCEFCKGEILILMDADTIIKKDTIENLVNEFEDSNVDAVAGNIIVGNKNNFLTRLQDMEYYYSTDFLKNALAKINGINVVPGALGAWRLSSIKKLGLFSSDTLTEDTDLTLSLLNQKGKIKFCANAIAYTEAPENISDLQKQRTRWTYGNLQCILKHKKLIFKNKAIGLITIPLLALPFIDIPLSIINFFNPFINPVLIIILSLINNYINFNIFSYVTIFKDKPLKNLLLFIPWQFLGIIFNDLIVLKCTFLMLKKHKPSWNKLKRSGKVSERFVYDEAS